MNYLLSDSEISVLLSMAERKLLDGEKIKFQRISKWRKQIVPDYPGVYALFEKQDDKFALLYIGETGNLRARMSDICRTVNHTFRRQLARQRFEVVNTRKRFSDEIELRLDSFFDLNLFVSFIEVNIGRLEIESHLITKHQSSLLNSETKRKLMIEVREVT